VSGKKPQQRRPTGNKLLIAFRIRVTARDRVWQAWGALKLARFATHLATPATSRASLLAEIGVSVDRPR